HRGSIDRSRAIYFRDRPRGGAEAAPLFVGTRGTWWEQVGGGRQLYLPSRTPLTAFHPPLGSLAHDTNDDCQEHASSGRALCRAPGKRRPPTRCGLGGTAPRRPARAAVRRGRIGRNGRTATRPRRRTSVSGRAACG